MPFLPLAPSMFLGQIAVVAQAGLACAVACGAVANAGALILNALHFIAASACIYWVTAYCNT